MTEESREDALMAVAIVSIRDHKFLRSLSEAASSEAESDLESTLWHYGFDLSSQEKERIRVYFDARRDLGSGEISEDLNVQLDAEPELEKRKWSVL